MAQGTANVTGHGATMKSWLVCLVMLAGVILGGVAISIWNWPLFWAGVAIFVVGVVLAKAVNIMEDVTEYGGGQGGHDPASSTY